MKICYTLNELDNVASQIIANLNTKTILLYGDMGAGKTTLIKSIIKALGSDDDVSSPTFSIVNEYTSKTEKIFHFDLYRIKNTEEAYNFGIEDYLDSEHWKLIEWPQIIESILFDDFDKIHLELDSQNQRILKLN
ncbi:tRNA (adenosine(37)-N6)-threonylcarbamoyltransferase complex ATPase subunit type 1 TsaE [uncultured Algibacter sp.]|uniref:tRNA (adenosine(37)-N6)-threonylcarbamoyltransferase complex ATPase subunit type 1 TsaE n=1 Tax=uncultured Algibacter sp. TaxID=298659 RepID=UPI003216E0C4